MPIEVPAVPGRVRRAGAAACALALPARIAADRVALLIGNNNYASTPLRNAVNDAKDLGEALKELGLPGDRARERVAQRHDRGDPRVRHRRSKARAPRSSSTPATRCSSRTATTSSRSTRRWARRRTSRSSRSRSAQIFDRMDRARTRFNFLILDACRDNPFAASFKLSSAGLAQMSSPSGTLIAYATSPGSVAADGYGRNGIYTKHILQNISVPDLPGGDHVQARARRRGARDAAAADAVGLVLAEGRLRVQRRSGRASGRGRPRPRARAPTCTLQIEREFWVSVRESQPPRRHPRLPRQVSERQLRVARAATASTRCVRPARAQRNRRCERTAEAPPAAVRGSEPGEACREGAGKADREAAGEARGKAGDRRSRARELRQSAAAPPRHRAHASSTAAPASGAPAPAPGAPKPIRCPAARSRPACARSCSPTARSIAAPCAARACTARASTSRRRSSTRANSTTGSSRANGTYVWDNGDRYDGPLRAATAPTGAASTTSPTATRTRAR